MCNIIYTFSRGINANMSFYIDTEVVEFWFRLGDKEQCSFGEPMSNSDIVMCRLLNGAVEINNEALMARAKEKPIVSFSVVFPNGEEIAGGKNVWASVLAHDVIEDLVRLGLANSPEEIARVRIEALIDAVTGTALHYTAIANRAVIKEFWEEKKPLFEASTLKTAAGKKPKASANASDLGL